MSPSIPVLFCPSKARWQLLDELAKANQEHKGSKRLDELAKIRPLRVEAFEGWGVGYAGGLYLQPFATKQRQLAGLRQYRPGGKVIAAPGGKAGLFGADKLADSKFDGAGIYLCKGPWDSITHSSRCGVQVLQV